MDKQNRSWTGLIVLMVALFFSCSDVDNQLGDDFIPDDQKMKVCIDTLYGINTFLTKSDSFPTSGMSYGYMGVAKDPVFGETKASFCAQYILNYFSTGSAMFGVAPLFDSLELSFSVNASFLGDTSKTQKFNVYELKENIYYDSTYYADIDPQTLAKSDPIFSFELQGVPYSEVTLKMDGEAARQFALRLIDTTGGAYLNDSLFYNKYKGFYFAPDVSSDQKACVYRLAISAMEMTLYTRNHTDETAATVKDTVVTYYAFENVSYHNAHLSAITHDYTGMPIQRINDTLPTSDPMDYGYVQTLGGVATFVRFTDDFVADLRGKIVPPYKSMAINKALLVWQMDDITVSNLDRAPARLGSYAKYKSFTGIPDYDYGYETSTGNPLMYDGYLSRTSGAYATDISIFLQQLVQKADSASQTFTLGPGGDLLADFKQVVIKTGASAPPLKVVATYTLVR